MGDETEKAPSTFDGAPIGRIAHEMNNSVAFVVTNLNLLCEEIERLSLDEQQRKRMLRMVDDATDGAGRVSESIRRLQVLSWGEDTRHHSDDTWDREGTRRRVLVIDDEPYILTSVQRALQNYDVVTAESGEQAVAILERDAAFDILLCDLVMGAMSGPEVYAWLGAHRPELLQRSIFMTAGAFTPASRSFLAGIRNPVLHKPFDTKTLRWILAQTARQQA